MALLYPWATKEYILKSMSIGQVILYLNVGIDTKYPKPKEEGESNRSYEELKKARDEMIEAGLIDSKETLEKKYGDIDDTKEVK